jgi:hypothetical protein
MPTRLIQILKGTLPALPLTVMTMACLTAMSAQSQQLPDRFNEQRVVAIVDQKPDGALLLKHPSGGWAC